VRLKSAASAIRLMPVEPKQPLLLFLLQICQSYVGVKWLVKFFTTCNWHDFTPIVCLQRVCM